MEKLQNAEQFYALRDAGKTAFVFTTTWCPDCHFIKPFMPEVEAKFGDYRFVEVDRDDFIDLCRSLDVLGIPSFIVYDKGQEIGRFVSKDHKTQEEIEAFFEGAK
ncbi:thioredoxin [Trichococcus palustris]|jgi:thiol-disulfide isomerase/thioredoxin|uniref:Thioredoxin n=1 Tax=Trichococcus palustris TaxID=140314 RepID=A0A143YLF7_9LACT|nr:thioredoxin family protein [Trichococcus palustris]CZQ91805.1 thioredoxin [Trichococcus palustris]SFL04286.1 Thioredoxin [Trichococcus palustris]